VSTNPQLRPTISQSTLKLRIYRQCRLWHGYLSAFAFVALLFFAITGILLNHPRWFAANHSPEPPVKLTLTAAQLQELRASQTPAETLATMVAAQTTLYGTYKDGAAAMDQIFARLRGARGTSDIRANLKDGSVVVTLERATTVGVLNALHRGEQAGSSWRLFIDIAAAVLIALSLVGYAIFLSMSTRLKTALVITGLSVLGMVMLFVILVR
jgi:uncharacterized protein